MPTDIHKPTIAICVATYRRPQLLAELLESFQCMDLPADALVELRIVDNDQAASARPTVDAFRVRNSSFKAIHYRVQEKQNIALTRNAAVEIGTAKALVFVDDDEEVSKQWLVALWQTFNQTEADGVYGPVVASFKENVPQWIQVGGFMEKPQPATGTRISWKQARTSNAMIRGSWFYGAEAYRFDPAFGLSGGEDTSLFARMELNGARFVSCQKAVVSEVVPSDRACFGWLWNRRYRNGLVYEQIARAGADNRHPFSRAVRRLFASMLWTLKGIPQLLSGKPSACIQGVLQLPLAWGGLLAWINPSNQRRNQGYAASSADENKATRVAFLTNIISPYRAPVFERLAAKKNWAFKVFVNAGKEFDRSWNATYSYLPVEQTSTWSLKRKVISETPVYFEQTITLHIPFALLRDLWKFRPEVIISHELGLRTGLAALYAFVTRTPLVIWAYQSRVSATQGSRRLLWRKWLLKRASRIVGMGVQAREVLEAWGVEESRIVDALNAADHNTLETRLKSPTLIEEVQSIKDEYADGRNLAIVVGRLIPLKGIEFLLQTWMKLPETLRLQWRLVFIGEGPLESLIQDTQETSIDLAGHVEPSKMAAWYKAADLHIFPSCGDVWGLVVNEASHCGTPTLCSIHAGCSDELIDHGFTGLSIDFTDPKTAREELKQALMRDDLIEIGKQAQLRAASFTLDNLANSFADAVEQAASSDQKETNSLKNQLATTL